jgi:hypothetical protein
MNKADRNLQSNSIVPQLVFQSTQASTDQLAQIVEIAATAPFADDLLEVDEPLWGSFWHGDVIAPGYRLPAIELALLRAIRLDRNWSEKIDTAQFLAGLRETIRHPQTGIWTIAIAGKPCVVFGGQPSEAEDLMAVVWYCATTEQLHAGYRTRPDLFYLDKAIEQRKPGFKRTPSKARVPLWLTQIEIEIPDGEQGPAPRLDAEILRLRRTGLEQR